MRRVTLALNAIEQFRLLKNPANWLYGIEQVWYLNGGKIDRRLAFEKILLDLKRGESVTSGPQTSRKASEPEGGRTVLKSIKGDA